MRIVRPVVQTTITLQETVRDLGRLREVASVLVRHGLGALIAGLNIPGIRAGPGNLQTTPERVRDALQALGPTFIKFGQILSTRPDIVPPRYIEALQSLQDDVAPISLEEVSGQIRSSLGDDWEKLILDMDETPIATGSIAQVHRARLAPDRDVVVKVLRPRIHETIRADISILNLLAHRLLVEFPEATYFDPLGILSEFERSIHHETDLKTEAANLKRFRENFQDHPQVFIPRAYDEATSSTVLTMDHVKGLRIREAREHGVDMETVGRNYLSAAYKMIFDDGFFHGDLHPGNVFVMPDGRLGLIDFGMVGRLTPEMKDNLVAILFALERGDLRSISRIYFDVGIKTVRVDYDAFERDVMNVMEQNWMGQSMKDIQVGRFLKELADGAIKHRVRAPPDYTMFFKAILTTEGLAKSLIAEIDPIKEVKPFIDRLIKNRFHPDRFKDELFYHSVVLRSLERRIPTTITQLLDDIQQQRLTLNVVPQPPASTRRAENRRHTQTLLAGMSMASLLAGTISLYMDAPKWLVLAGLPYLSIGLFTSSLVFWCWTLLLLFRGRNS